MWQVTGRVHGAKHAQDPQMDDWSEHEYDERVEAQSPQEALAKAARDVESVRARDGWRYRLEDAEAKPI